MKIYIAESKSMRTAGSATTTCSGRPPMQHLADEIIHSLRGRSVPELSDQLKISPSLARKMYECVYNFSSTDEAMAAIEAYTGVVFRKLDYPTLSPYEKSYANQHLRIISSLYGFLRPTDCIREYRMEFSSKVLGANSVKALLSEGVTEQVLSDAGAGEELLLLLPGDALSCLKLKEIGKKHRITKVRFMSVEDGSGAIRTPHAGRLKELRGLLAREIITSRIDTIADVATLNTPHFVSCPESSTPDTLAFLTI